MNEDGLNPTEHHQMLTEMADSFNAGILAAENNEVSPARSKDDALYFSGTSLIGKNNLQRNEAEANSQGIVVPGDSAAPVPELQAIQFPDNPGEAVRVEQIPRSHFK